MPKNVVIVGGSVAGLIHGLQLKRQGNNVTILERDQRSLRSSHDAGIAYRAGMKGFLDKYDDTGTRTSIDSNRLHVMYRPYPRLFERPVTRPLKFEFTSWGVLCRLLRANFDGCASKPFPDPPSPRSGDGEAVYLTGMTVTDLKVSGDGVEVYFSDARTGETASMAADLVIAADGVRSTVRKIVQAPAVSAYSGFIAWRGTVPQSELSEEAAGFFADGLVYDLMHRTYILCYVIPTDDGVTEPGKRLVNWVWYTNVSEHSQEMREIFTDAEGRVHGNTLAQGMVSSTVWSRIRDEGISKMTAPFAELLRKTEAPFVTRVNDVLCTRARYLDDRVLLVGDALTTLRSNIAMSTESAVNHALLLEKVMEGDMPMERWEKEMLQFSGRLYHTSRAVADFGLASWLDFAATVGRYLAFMIMMRWTEALATCNIP